MRYFTKAFFRPIKSLATKTIGPSTHLDDWLQIHREMRNEARDIVNNTVEQKTIQINEHINTLQTDLRSLKTDVNTLKTDVSTLKTDVNTLKTDVSTLKTDVNTLKTDVNTLKTDVNTLKTDVNILKNDVQSLKNDVKETSRNIHELYKQNTNNTRLILGAFFGFTSAGVAINQYFLNEREQLVSNKIGSTITGPR